MKNVPIIAYLFIFGQIVFYFGWLCSFLFIVWFLNSGELEPVLAFYNLR